MAKKVPFKVVHASGADDGFGAKELEIHSPTTKGWRSSKFCVYPQEIILMLQESMRIRKLQILAHQYLIATKIELFIGSIPEGQSSSLLTCKFKRLGHVSLVDNQNTDYKSRELKSVHLDAHGQFIKLFIHKNYVNKYNLYNQVQIIATNIIAENIESFNGFSDTSSANKLVDEYMKQDLYGDPLWGKINKPDYVSPLDDIAFAMYQDPQTAEIIRELEQKKKEAIKEDEFVEAKKFHQVINDLQKVGERLGRLNVEKQKAIEIEDYDLAMVKKQQIDEYRKVVTDRLVWAGIIQELNKEEGRALTDRNSNNAPPTNRFTMSPPLPPIARRDAPQTQSPEISAPVKSPTISPRPPEDKVASPKSPAVSPVQNTAADERPLPTMNKKDTLEPVDQSPKEDASSPLQDGPCELKEKDAREASLAIDVFGEHVVRCIYSKQWTYRQQGMDAVKRELTSEKPELIAEQDSRSVIRAVVDLLKKGINEQVHPVFLLCLSILKDLLTTYIPKRDAQSEISFVLQKTIPLLLPKTGEMAARMKNSAVEFILEISQLEDVKSLGVIPEVVTHPFKTKQQTIARLYTGRIELVEKLLAVLNHEETTPNGFSTASTMKFLLPALEHASGGVRDAAVKVIFELYKLKAPVRGFLPADEPATRKNPLYRSIFDGFDKIDGKPTEAERKAKAKSDRETAEKAKQKEIDELHAHLQALREMAAKQGDVEADKATKDQPAVDTSTKPEPTDVDRMCIFCGMKDETFTEEVLDTHYWKSCPMLKRCLKCSQVIEICRQNQHLMEECESKSSFASCPKCKEAVARTELTNHTHDKVCPKKSGNRCPLCRKVVGTSEEAWRSHLTKQCPPNTKRLQQSKQQGNKVPFASMTSLRAKGSKSTAAVGKATRNTSKAVPRKEKVYGS